MDIKGVHFDFHRFVVRFVVWHRAVFDCPYIIEWKACTKKELINYFCSKEIIVIYATHAVSRIYVRLHRVSLYMLFLMLWSGILKIAWGGLTVSGSLIYTNIHFHIFVYIIGFNIL